MRTPLIATLLALCLPSTLAQASCCRDECNTVPPMAPSGTSCWVGTVGATGNRAPQLLPIPVSGLLCQTSVTTCTAELMADGGCSLLGAEVTALAYGTEDNVAMTVNSGMLSNTLKVLKLAWCNTDACNSPAFAAECLARPATPSPSPPPPLTCCQSECQVSAARPIAYTFESCLRGIVGSTRPGGSPTPTSLAGYPTGAVCVSMLETCTQNMTRDGDCRIVGESVWRLATWGAEVLPMVFNSSIPANANYYANTAKLRMCNRQDCNTAAAADACLQRSPSASMAPRTPSSTRTPGLVVSSCCGEACRTSSMAPVPAPLQCWQGAEGSMIADQSPGDSWCIALDQICDRE